MPQQENYEKFARLRQLAQEKIHQQSLNITYDIAGLSPDERLQVIEDLQEERTHTRHLVHELQVHQTELEMQHAELQQAQERLQNERDRYAELYHNAPVGYLTTTRRGYIFEINAIAIRMLNMDPTQPMGHTLQEFIVPDDQDIYYFHLQSLFGSMSAQTCELRLQQRDGTFLFVRLESTFATDEHDIPQCRTALLDITARKQAEQSLYETNGELEQRVEARTDDLVHANARLQTEIEERKQLETDLRHARDAADAANQTKSIFLASMSHELRTPLNAVIGMAQLLDQTPLTITQQEYMTTIHTSSELLLSLISDILDFSKIEAGRMDLDQYPFDVRSCVQTACTLLEQRATDKGLYMKVVIAESVTKMVQGDKLRVQQILMNLLSNAIKFTERGGIVVSVTPVLGSSPTSIVLQLSVQDTGIGMNPEQQTRLFQAFNQADNSITRQYGGTGLGLAISQRLAQAMGGSIQVESIPGQGSTFHVTLRFQAILDASVLPHSSSIEAPPLVLDASLGQQYPLRVLLVEDDYINQRVLVRMLELLGYNADVAKTGQEALDAVTSKTYDVILMDVQMPEMDGITATQHIRTQRVTDREPYIIALTAHSASEDRQRCLDAGMNDYLTKPIRLEQLATVLLVQATETTSN